jgi:hypothetical protein
MKKVILTEEQFATLVVALNKISVTGLQQAEQMTLCKQILDAVEIVDEKDGERE